MSKIKIETISVGSESTPSEKLRKDIQDIAQARANEGWTLRAKCSRGGSVYMTFARKEKGE
jgi:hypothetical protein